MVTKGSVEAVVEVVQVIVKEKEEEKDMDKSRLRFDLDTSCKISCR